MIEMTLPSTHLSVTEAPHNTDFHTWMGKNICVSFKPPRVSATSTDLSLYRPKSSAICISYFTIYDTVLFVLFETIAPRHHHLSSENRVNGPLNDKREDHDEM